MKTWNDFIAKQKIEKDDKWEMLVSISESNEIKGVSLDELISSKNVSNNIVTGVKKNAIKYPIVFEFTLNDLYNEKLIKCETTIKDSDNKYFERTVNIANESIKNSKKYKIEKDTNHAKSKKYEFDYSIDVNDWKFKIFAFEESDVFDCIQSIFEAFSDRLDITLTSNDYTFGFEECFKKWINHKIHH